MVDFNKRLGGKGENKKIDPFEIYESLDRRSITGPLRPVQQTVLSEWHNNSRNDKDLVIKLHTGSGKTLIGLLTLLSRLNERAKPCIYLCPNIYLAHQVCQDAKKFGIPFCTIGENGIPNQFYDGQKILITHSQKFFNGKTIFGLDNDYTECDSIILDDSHACIDSIKDAFTVKINSKHELYEKILRLFEEDLIKQGHGTFLEIKDRVYNSQLPVPYWSFLDKKEEVLKLLSEYKDSENSILFSWPLIKDSLNNLQLHFSGHGFELSPYHIPIERFGAFHHANQRILMSATTQDDSFFIKGLAFLKKAVLNPLEDTNRLWSGEKMLLIPSLINDDLDRNLIVTQLAKRSKRTYGTVALTPSFRLTRQYKTVAR
jgi:hypothetical protein